MATQMTDVGAKSRYTPLCRYFRGKQQCPFHPACRYYHPACKFYPNCTRALCQYNHLDRKVADPFLMQVDKQPAKPTGRKPEIQSTIGPEFPCEWIPDIFGCYHRNMFKCAEYCHDYFYPSLQKRASELKDMTIQPLEDSLSYGVMIVFDGTDYGLMASIHPSVLTRLGKTLLYEVKDGKEGKSALERPSAGYTTEGRFFESVDEVVKELQRVQPLAKNNFIVSSTKLCV